MYTCERIAFAVPSILFKKATPASTGPKVSNVMPSRNSHNCQRGPPRALGLAQQGPRGGPTRVPGLAQKRP